MPPRDGSDRLPAWRRYLRFWRADSTGDVGDEMEFHLQSAIDEFVTAGMSPDAAREAARRKFGDVDDVRRTLITLSQQRERHMARTEWFDALRQDLVFGVRDDWTMLRDILDKGIASITEAEHAAIRNKWLGVTYRLTLDWRRYLGVIIPLGAGLALIILVIAIWNRRLRSQIRRRREAEAALSAQFRTLQSILEAMPDGTGAVMIDGKMQDDATWKQAKVIVDLARLVASKDPEKAAAYGL